MFGSDINEVIMSHIDNIPKTDICFGTVTSIEPLKVRINEFTEVDEGNLILTEAVIRKEFHIAVHTHLFEQNTFKHNHGSPLQYPTDVNLVANGNQGAPIATSQLTVTFKDSKKDYDLSHDSEEDFETLPNAEPSASTITVKINGEQVPLSKDPDGESEDDVDGTEKYWAVLNHGLHKDDKVLLLRCMNNQRFVILSKVYEKPNYREDKE